MSAFFDMIPPSLLALAALITVCAGVVKGATGFGQPLIMVAGMGMFLDPRLAIAGLVLPTVASNLLQVVRSGLTASLAAFKDFRLYILLVCIMILVTSQFVSVIPARVMLGVLGVPVLALSLIQLVGLRLTVPPHRRPLATVVIGLISGAMGGFAGTWGPTTVLYLLAMETPKLRQVAVQGVIYGAGSIMLLSGHLSSGVLNARTVWFSLALVLPSFLGMWIGFRIQDRIDQETFRKATLVVLLVAGANLIRRAVMG